MENKKVKIGLFLGATFLASIFLGRASGKFFAYNFFEFLEVFWEFVSKAVLRLMLAGMAFCLPALFLTTAQWLLMAALVNGLGFFFGFWWVAGSQDLGSGLFLVFLFVLCQQFFFKEVQKRAKLFVAFFSRDIFIPKIAPFFFLVTLVFSLSFYLGLKKEIDQGEFFIPDKVFEGVVGPITHLFQAKLQEGLKQELGGQIEKKIEEEARSRLDSEELDEPSGEKAEVKPGADWQYELDLDTEDLFEIKPFNLQELKTKVQDAIKPFLKYLPFLAALSLYFTLRIVIGFLLIFLPWLIPLMFEVLIKLGVLEIVEERKTVQRLSL